MFAQSGNAPVNEECANVPNIDVLAINIKLILPNTQITRWKRSIQRLTISRANSSKSPPGSPAHLRRIPRCGMTWYGASCHPSSLLWRRRRRDHKENGLRILNLSEEDKYPEPSGAPVFGGHMWHTIMNSVPFYLRWDEPQFTKTSAITRIPPSTEEMRAGPAGASTQLPIPDTAPGPGGPAQSQSITTTK